MARLAPTLFSRHGGLRPGSDGSSAARVPDAELVEQCRAGDRHAWVQLVNRYARLVYAIPRACGLDEQEASLVLESVFAWLITNLEQLTQHEQLHAALVVCARQTTLWRLCALGRSKPDGSPPDLHDVLCQTRQIEAAELLRLAVSALAPTDRELILASLREPAPTERAAVVPDATVQASPERLSAALAHLLEMLQKLGLEELLPVPLLQDARRAQHSFEELHAQK